MITATDNDDVVDANDDAEDDDDTVYIFLPIYFSLNPMMINLNEEEIKDADEIGFLVPLKRCYYCYSLHHLRHCHCHYHGR